MASTPRAKGSNAKSSPSSAKVNESSSVSSSTSYSTPGPLEFTTTKVITTTTTTVTTTTSASSNAGKAPKLNLAVYRYSAWLEENQLKRTAPWIAVAVALLIRWVVSLGPYSGMGTPPRYGDYEAQRHWMELTLHRPAVEWYSDESKWWDLDYPPLTAYVSWLCGYIGHQINPDWFEWETSRGYESPEAKLYMRSTVLVLEFLVYFTSIIAFTNIWFANKSWTRKHTALVLILLQPGLILIDDGHFQYNAVMLGLVVWSVNCFLVDRDVIGSMFFCCALMFKQMALYFAPAVFAYLFGKCFRQGFFGFFWKLFKLGATVIVMTSVMFDPWLEEDAVMFMQALNRIFPLFRGLYQDKVANVWCAVNIVVKLRESFEVDELVVLSTAATLVAFIPSVLHQIAKPTKRGLIYGLVNSSLSFFLFSFQVHEKSILVPALPITLLILDEPAEASLFITLATFTMYPLLGREGLGLQYSVLLGGWIWMTWGTLKNASMTVGLLALLNVFVIGAIHLAEVFVPPPERYPDIYPVLNTLWGAGGFVLYWAYFNYRQFTLVNAPNVGIRVTKSTKQA